ncbi:MAG: UDP-N-acetylmuramoyl-L-alanyl-D-glutamate--2,6-diaminopimelate ligase [Muribaculaceae bacterium]|nr:UDP-N-acetylmuramoyl-L-alanyl-D-glutamate--2,6-diaminopimelate ligase [Muribaculaceae bacterium]
MNIDRLLSAITPEASVGETTVTDIEGLTADSREVKPGWVFVAVPGVSVDGHKFIPAAVKAGAAVVVCENIPEQREEGTVYIKVTSSAIALGLLASRWFDDPSEKIRLVGVTGTNGKTTTATLIYEMARLRGHKAGLLSTVCNYVDSTPYPTDHTTPDPITINRLLAEMVEAGCEYAAMEVSSHAAHQHRIAGLKFAGGVFTNLTRDHLDYHKTFEAYIAAKKMFFDSLPAGSFALTNADDRNGAVMLQNTAAKRYTYSLRGEADFMGRIVEQRLDGTLLSLNGKEVETMFTGRFNAYNLTAVYGAARLLGWPEDEVLRCVSQLVPVAGRFQTFRSKGGVTAIVDYAHTPDALVNVLDTIREVVGPRGEIITVVGCGGNRDAGKRPIMAKEAAARSNRLILTSDNPRFEEPEAILADMEAGLDEEGRSKTLHITDRREAISKAIAMASDGTVVLVAGKGHEDYQEICGVKHHFDDREEVMRELNAVK